jgi:hypothetical protein
MGASSMMAAKTMLAFCKVIGLPCHPSCQLERERGAKDEFDIGILLLGDADVDGIVDGVLRSLCKSLKTLESQVFIESDG